MLDTFISGFRVLRETSLVIGDAWINRGNQTIPLHSSSITAEWLTKALQTQIPKVQVLSAEHLSEVYGTTTHVLIALTYNDVGNKIGLPATMYLKLAPRESATRVFLSLFNLGRHETRFYNELSSEISQFVPKVYYSISANHGSRFVLLLEDLNARNNYTKDITATHTIEEARAVMKVFASIHGKYWESNRFKGDLAWLPTYRKDKNKRLNRLMRKWAFKRTLKKYGVIIPNEVKNAGRYINGRYDDLEKYWAQPPTTLVHGDPHVGNMYFNEQDVGFLDWQVVRQGQGMRDVSYFIVASLPTIIRQAHEKELIQLYLNHLSEMGISDLDFEKAWEQHRLHAFYTWIAQIITAAAGTLQREPIVRAGLKRTGIAIVDLDSLGALRSL